MTICPLLRQPLDIGGKSEVLGGPQEAWSDERVCVCPPGPDTPENASSSRVDVWPALSVVTPGGGAGGGSVHYVRLPSGSGQMVTPWIKGCHWAGSFVAPPLCLFFLSVFHISWIPDLRCAYLSLSHRCFISLPFWDICNASDKQELTPVSQWDSLHASLLFNCVPFYIFWIRTLFGHDNHKYVLHFLLHFSYYWCFPMARLSSLMYVRLFTFPFTSFAFGITPKLHWQDWCTGPFFLGAKWFQ